MKKIIFLCLTMFLSVFSWEGIAQVPGSTCGNPLAVYSVPFNDSGNTSGYGDDYEKADVPDPPAPGAITNGTSYGYYINGDDVVYSYTAGANGFITINTSNHDATYVGVLVFTGCPFTATVGYHVASSGTTRSIPNLPVVAGQTYYIVISTWASPQSTSYTIDITGTQVQNPPTCLPPTGLTASGITANSANLSWTENGTATHWDIEWGAKGFTPTGTPNVVGTMNNPYTLSPLNPQTEYDFYVRADCGGGDLSTWSGPLTFLTECVAAIAPWSEDFENGGAIPFCWDQGAANNEPWKFSNTGSGNHIGNNGTITGNTASGGYFAWVDDSTPDSQGTTLISPLIDVSALTTPELSFYLMSHNEGNSNVNFSVDVYDGAAWNNDVFTSNTNTANGGWEKITVSLSSLTFTGNMQLRFVVDEPTNGDYFDDVALDDVSIHEQPTCPAPKSLDAINITSNSADLKWTETGTATVWDIEWGVAGFTPTGTPTNAGVTTNPFPLTPLLDDTSYDFYVRANCGAGDVSTWVGPYTFRTTCAIATVPYELTFEVGANCATVQNAGLGNNWTLYNGTSNGFSGDYARYAYDLSNAANAWLYTNGIALTGGVTYQLDYKYGNNTTSYNEKMKVAYGTANDVTAMTTILADHPTINQGTAQFNTVYFTPVTTGTYYIGFNAYSDANQYYLYLDDIFVTEAPSCFQPENIVNTAATTTTADFTWDNAIVLPGVGYEYVVMAPGVAPDVTTALFTGTSATNLATVSGLSALTQYDFYVRSDCGSGDYSLWEGPLTFFTDCTGPLVGTYTVGGATADFATLSEVAYGLNNCGISGAVVFNVNAGSGPFNEQVTIEQVTGASATNTITFNGNGETVTAATTSDSRFLFLLDGADYVTIDNFNLVTIEDMNNFVIHLINGANYNTISNNTIDMTSTFSSSSSTNAGIVMSGSLTSATTAGPSGSDLSVTDNTIIGGYYGVVINGESSAIHTMNNNIAGNTILDFYYYGVYSKYASNGSVSGNDIHRTNRGYTSTMNGIYYVSGGESNLIEANLIHDAFTADPSATGSAYGIYFSSNDATVGNENVVVNNVIYNFNGVSGAAYGLYNSGSDGVHYYYNTVSLDYAGSSSGSTYGFYQTTTASNIELKNNIISITRGGTGTKYAMYFSTAASSIVSNYNDLYVNAPAGTNSIGYSGSAKTTLTDWQTAGYDANSLDLDPMLAAPQFGNLRPTNVAIDNMGTPIAGITTDIDGNTRSATTPDMGAYEFTPPTCFQPSNLSVSSITEVSASLMWQENGTAVEWEVEYGPAGFTQGTGTTAIVTGTPGYTITTPPLTANTSYQFYVRANCSPTDSSLFTGPMSFRTLCSSTSVPYVMDFDSATVPLLPECTLGEKVGTIGNMWTTEVAPTGYTGNVLRYKYHPTTPAGNANAWFYTQGIQMEVGKTYQISYKYGNNSSYHESMKVAYGLAPNATAMTIPLADHPDITGSGNETVNTVTFSPSATDVYYFGFNAYSIPNQLYLYLDDIEITRVITCPEPTALVVSNITDISAAVSWTESGTATAWEIEYGPTGFTQGTAAGTIVPDNDGTLGEILSLAANTTYDVYVRAICAVGDESTWLGPETFTTLVTPCVDPSAIVVSNITDDSAAISWTENGTATEWEIEYGLAGFTQGSAGGTIVSDNDGTLGETLSGLNDNTAYDVYVRAICTSTNMSAWIGPKAFTTLVTPCVDPSAIVVSNITDSSAAVSWTENGTATEWEIEYGLAGFTQGTAGGTIVLDNDGTLGETLSGLDDATAYDVYVRAICTGTNTSAWVGPKAFTTLVTPCVDPSAIVVSNITDSTADVSWTENGTATEWEIEYGLSGFTQGSGTIVSDNDGTLGETLSGLDDETAYDVYVRAICTSTNMSAWVGPVSFTTLVTPCAAPSAILVSNITDSTADVSWTENGTATEWEIEYGLAGFTPGSGIIVSDNDGTLGETLTGLDDETAYDVYVRAICTSTNMSAWVGPESFTTDTKIKVGENEFIGFTYYPNPMMDVINITGQNQRYELTIFNVIGQQLLTYKMEANTATLDVSHFASGQYLMQVVSESGKTAFYKLIKN